MSFSEWKTYRLGDLVLSANTGLDAIKRAPIVSKDTGIKCLRIQDVSQEKIFSNWGFCDVNELNYKKFQLKKNDLIIARTGETVGVNRLMKENLKAVFNNGLIRIRVNEANLNPLFLYYSFQSRIFNNHINSIARGTSTQPNMRIEALLDYNIEIPDLNTQRHIASILSSLDDAIELNQQINKTSDEIPKTLFKEWFVKFNFPDSTNVFQDSEIGKIPAGWTVETFEDVFDADRGLSYKGAGLAQSDATPMHNLNSVLEGGGYKTIGIKYYNGDYKDKHIVNSGELIIANTEQGHKYMLIGYPAIIPQFYGEQGIFSHHIYRLRPKKNCWLSPDFMYHLLLQPHIREQIIGFANGTTVNMLKIEGLHKPKFAMPPKELAEKFTAIAKANRLQAEQNIEENQSLSNLRDTLLPKLMKGEINVNLQ